MTITVGERERSELKAAMARARAHPVPWEVLKRRITEQDGPNMGHVEDQPVAHERPAAEFVDLPFGYVVARASKSNRPECAYTYRFRVRGREWRQIW